MRTVIESQVSAALLDLGVQPGDGLLVHSAVQFLGQPEGGLDLYYRALCAAVNCVPPHPNSAAPAGTLAVPAFNFGFARGEPFDPAHTPSQGMGVFSEFVRRLPEARRTSHPMQSLAVVGHFAGDLAERDTLSAFDPGSAFERLLELDFKLLQLGADIQAVSMLHYSEQRYQVPYRYWKEFTGPVNTAQGWETRTYRMYVRYLEADPRIELYPVQDRLQQLGLWRSVHLNYGKISLCRLSDFVAVVDQFLAADPWSLVVNRNEVQAAIRKV